MLVLLALLQLPAPQHVKCPTDDGVEIAASFYAPKDRDAPALVLVHQLGATRAEWQPIITALRADRDYAILAIDLRGHGESIKTKDGHTLDWQKFTDADWHKLPQDVHAAFDWLRANKTIAPRSVGGIGSSIGGSALIIHAAPQATVRAIALLSPGLEYKGLHIRSAFTRCQHRPVLMVAAEGDARSFETLATLEKIAGHRTHFVRLDGSAHGTKMAAEHADLTQKIVEFFRKNL
jgi:pimeloyl-ACP methyl ester carboxylesterase